MKITFRYRDLAVEIDDAAETLGLAILQEVMEFAGEGVEASRAGEMLVVDARPFEKRPRHRRVRPAVSSIREASESPPAAPETATAAPGGRDGGDEPPSSPAAPAAPKPHQAGASGPGPDGLPGRTAPRKPGMLSPEEARRLGQAKRVDRPARREVAMADLARLLPGMQPGEEWLIVPRPDKLTGLAGKLYGLRRTGKISKNITALWDEDPVTGKAAAVVKYYEDAVQ